MKKRLVRRMPLTDSRGTKTVELANIQFLRAVAAVSVIFVHLEFLLARLGAHTFGRGGVDLFFVISGFIMVHTTRDRERGAALFLRNRASRIVPVYWLLTFAVFGIAAVFPHALNSTVANFWDLVRSLLFIPFVKESGLTQPLLYVGWTLNYEMFFYLLFALGLCIRPYALGLLAIALMLTGLLLIGLLLQPFSPVVRFYTDPVQLEFMLGMLVGIVAPGIQSRISGWQIRGAVVIFIFCLSAVVMKDFVFRFWPPFPKVAAAGLLSAATLFLAIILERSRYRITAPLILAIGDASYSLYLIQPFTAEAFEKIGMAVHANGFVAIGLMALCTGMTIVAALTLYRFVERPLTLAARRLLPLEPH